MLANGHDGMCDGSLSYVRTDTDREREDVHGRPYWAEPNGGLKYTQGGLDWQFPAGASSALLATDRLPAAGAAVLILDRVGSDELSADSV